MKVSLTPSQKQFIARKMKSGGYLSEGEVVREALRVYQLVDEQDYGLEEALREGLNSPLRAYTKNHFTGLITRRQKRAA
jgi:putative addiction module CopG family antidote